ETKTPAVKQGAAIGGWLCFGLGMLLMYWSVWSFLLYGPLFLVAFILAIVALAQSRIILGLILLLSCLVLPALTFLILSSSRASKFMDDHPVPGLEPIRRPAQQVPAKPIQNNTPSKISEPINA